MDRDEEEFGTFSAQTMIAILVAFLTCVMWNASRHDVERGNQSDINPVDSIVIPTSVYCSPGGECYHTSRKCEGLQNVPMNAVRRRRSCMYCVQRDGRWNGEHREGCTGTTESIALGPVHLSRALMKQRGTVLWLPGWLATDRCSQAIAGGNDKVGRTP